MGKQNLGPNQDENHSDSGDNSSSGWGGKPVAEHGWGVAPTFEPPSVLGDNSGKIEENAFEKDPLVTSAPEVPRDLAAISTEEDFDGASSLLESADSASPETTQPEDKKTETQELASDHADGEEKKPILKNPWVVIPMVAIVLSVLGFVAVFFYANKDSQDSSAQSAATSSTASESATPAVAPTAWPKDARKCRLAPDTRFTGPTSCAFVVEVDRQVRLALPKNPGQNFVLQGIYNTTDRKKYDLKCVRGNGITHCKGQAKVEVYVREVPTAKKTTS